MSIPLWLAVLIVFASGVVALAAALDVFVFPMIDRLGHRLLVKSLIAHGHARDQGEAERLIARMDEEVRDV